ncbi:MAG: hypothetical protein KF744_02910 [Taibaiella sp.]|nr:hypothetical protein [Taibaiella sp.]
MTATAIRKTLHSYLEIADDKKIKAIYTLLEREIAESATEAGDHWESPEFIAEMNRRVADMQSGKDKGRSWDDVKRELKRKTTSR